MANTTVDDARELIEKRLVGISEERERLERALAELNGGARRRRPGRPRRRKPAKAAPRRKRPGGRSELGA